MFGDWFWRAEADKLRAERDAARADADRLAAAVEELIFRDPHFGAREIDDEISAARRTHDAELAKRQG